MTVLARGALGWSREIVLGLYRSALLVGLTAPIPAIGAAVGFFGTLFALSWSAKLTSPLIVVILATAGEAAMGAVWTAIAVLLAIRRGGRPLSQAARLLAGRWLGLRIEAQYRPLPPVTQMSTGFWWNGHEYHRTEREARWQGRRSHGLRDPQLYRDALWIAAAAVTVLPAAALPLLGLAAGIYVAPAHAGYGAAMIIVGLALAPFAWRILGPVASRFLGSSGPAALGKRVRKLESIQADMTQTQAAELERIERGLHDGAQSRLVALGMSMGAAEQLIDADPAAARAILAEARASSAAALAELRSLVRGINPPVLAERGLVDAVRALALDAPVQVAVRSNIPSRPERPVESAIYFAVSELLANAAKHAHARQVSVELGYGGRTLTAAVTDDGVGGATASHGSGLNGIERRMAALGGHVEIDSPAGGPTRVTVAVPCVLS